MYGIQIESKDDKFIQIAEAALESLVLGVPGQFLVDSIPICEWYLQQKPLFEKITF